MKFVTDRLSFSKVHLLFPVGQIDLSEVKNACLCHFYYTCFFTGFNNMKSYGISIT